MYLTFELQEYWTMKDQMFDIAIQEAWNWTINGASASEELSEHLFLEYGAFSPLCCPYCRVEMDHNSFNDFADDSDDWHNDRIYLAQTCPRCSHWEFSGSEGGNRCMDAPTVVLLSSISARFEDDIPHACNEELSQHLRRNPQKWHEINPHRFEKLVADIFKANYMNSEVIHVGGPGDRGIDVIFIESNGRKWLIQAKRRADPKKAERFSTLQSILGTLVLERETHGIVVSTSNCFSRQAKLAQNKASQAGFIIRTVDKGVLDRMIGALLPSTPWSEIFNLPELNHLSDDVKDQFSDLNGTHQSFDPNQLELFSNETFRGDSRG